MHVTLLQAHPCTAPSMRRVAHALHRYLPVPSEIRYVSPSPPAVLRSRLPSSIVHLLYVLRVRQYLQRLATCLSPCDVLHVIDHSECFLLPPTRARLKAVTCHDLIPIVEARAYRHALSRWLGRRLYQLTVQDITCADGVFACSHATAREVSRIFHIELQKLRVVYGGVDTDFFFPLAEHERRYCRQKMGFDTREILVLHVGSNAPYKNIPTVVRTVAYLHHNGYQVRWVKAGQPLSPSLQRLARTLHITNCIHTEAYVDDRRLRELYQTCDVLLFPSLREGFGLPVLEAIACGTPAVVADTPALSEWAGAVCLSAPPDDIRALAESVLRSVEERSSVGYQARLREFAMQYSWQQAAQQLVQSYREWGAL
ncbi:MAG: glycosyltransferase family 4 protein [bacterium]|nr:glycosyltransferase family 4 protein [bacterium]